MSVMTTSRMIWVRENAIQFLSKSVLVTKKYILNYLFRTGKTFIYSGASLLQM